MRADNAQRNPAFLIGLGANLASSVGRPVETIRFVIDRLTSQPGWSGRASRLYRSSPVPRSDQPDFVNGALWLRCDLTQQALLDHVKALEAEVGRTPSARWSARPIDIDVLGYGHCIHPSESTWWSMRSSGDPAAITESVMVPHPRLDQRLFVLRPLMDIAPGWRHPVLNITVKEMYDACIKRGEDDHVELLDPADFA